MRFAPDFFSRLVMMFLMRKKHSTARFYGGMVSISSVKQHPRRPNFWNWRFGSLEFGRLLDWLGEYERCLITQRERKTITGKAGLAPRVILVFCYSDITISLHCQVTTSWTKTKSDQKLIRMKQIFWYWLRGWMGSGRIYHEGFCARLRGYCADFLGIFWSIYALMNSQIRGRRIFEDTTSKFEAAWWTTQKVAKSVKSHLLHLVVFLW